MNQIRQWICRSAHWKKRLQEKRLTSVVNEIDFTDNVVEIGLGITTDWLRRRFTRLTVVESTIN